MFLATSFAAIAMNTEKGADAAEQNGLGAGTPSYGWYGTGIATNFTITNADELAGFANIVNGTTGGDPAKSDFFGKTVTLANNIDLSTYNKASGFNSGNGWVPIGISDSNCFRGTFDGNGKKITGLETEGLVYVGLFGALHGAVKNLGVEGADVKGTTCVGIIAGRVVTGNGITNCYTTGAVAGGMFVGGIAGTLDGGNATGCYSAANVTVTDTGYAGGIAGDLSSYSRITDCYSTGVISGTASVGGIAGECRGPISNCYSTGEVKGTGNNVGGIAGIITSTGDTHDCAALNSKVEGNTHVGRVAGKVDAGGTCVSNKAFGGMNVVRPGGMGDGNDGSAVTATEIWVDSRIGLFTSTPWPLSTPPGGKMPGIGELWDTPAHLLPAALYTITVSNGGNGTGSADFATSPAGIQITLSATPDSGYRFKQWNVISGSVTIVDNKFTMPASNVEVRAVFELTPIHAVTFGVTGGNGTLTAKVGTTTLTSPANVADGSDVVFTATPDAGYRIKAWYRDGILEAGVGTDNPVTLPNIAGAVNFTVEFELIPVTPDPDGGGLPIMLIAGVIAAVAIIGFAVYWFVIRKK